MSIFEFFDSVAAFWPQIAGVGVELVSLLEQISQAGEESRKDLVRVILERIDHAKKTI